MFAKGQTEPSSSRPRTAPFTRLTPLSQKPSRPPCLETQTGTQALPRRYKPATLLSASLIWSASISPLGTRRSAMLMVSPHSAWTTEQMTTSSNVASARMARGSSRSSATTLTEKKSARMTLGPTLIVASLVTARRQTRLVPSRPVLGGRRVAMPSTTTSWAGWRKKPVMTVTTRSRPNPRSTTLSSVRLTTEVPKTSLLA